MRGAPLRRIVWWVDGYAVRGVGRWSNYPEWTENDVAAMNRWFDDLHFEIQTYRGEDDPDA